MINPSHEWICQTTRTNKINFYTVITGNNNVGGDGDGNQISNKDNTHDDEIFNPPTIDHNIHNNYCHYDL